MLLNIKLSSVVRFLILLLISTTFIFNISEVTLIMQAKMDNLAYIYTPWYIKIIKDIFLFLILSIELIILSFKKSINKIVIIFLPFLFLTFLSIYLTLLNDPPFFQILAGFRWIIFFFIPFFIFNTVNQDLLRRSAYILFSLFLINIFLQIYQYFFIYPRYGLDRFGFSVRNAGFFSVPNTAAFFTIITFLFNYYYQKNFILKFIVLLLSPISLYLTASGTGYVAFLLILITLILGKRYIKIIPFITLILIPFFYILMDALTNRSGVITESFAERTRIFQEAFVRNGLISSNFGLQTNVISLISQITKLSIDPMVAESTLTSILANLGFIAFSLTLFVCAFVLLYAIINNNLALFSFIILFSVFGLTTVFTEAFPINILFSMVVAFYLKSFQKVK